MRTKVDYCKVLFDKCKLLNSDEYYYTSFGPDYFLNFKYLVYMKIKILLAVTILIYIVLVLLINKYSFIGYLATIDFMLTFILFVILFKDSPKKS